MIRYAAILIFIFLFLYIVPLGFRPMASPDETRYGEIPREMLASGDWVVPRLDGFRYFEKPVLGYWFSALSMKLFGKSAFAIRFPCAGATGLCAWLVFLWAKRYFDSRTCAFFSALVFLLSFQVMGLGVFCVLDSVFSFFVTAAMIAFFFGYTQATQARKRILFSLCGLACGLGFLTKGLLAFVLPVIIILPFLVWERRFKELLRFAWIPMVTAILVVLPWSIMIHRREPDFWHYFVWTEHVNRFLRPEHGQHPFPVWFFIPVLLGGALPWTFLLPLGLGRHSLKKLLPKGAALRFAVCWFAMPFIFFSLSSGKLGTYILPCFAPLALLTSVGLQKLRQSGKTKGLSIIGGMMTVISLLLLAALILGQFLGSPPLYASSEIWKAFVAGAGLLVWGAFSLKSSLVTSVHAKLVYFAFAPIVFMSSWHFILPNALIAKKMPMVFLATLPDIPQDSILVSDNYQATSACWFYDRNDVYLLGRIGEYRYGLTYDDSSHRELDIDAFRQLLQEKTSTRSVVLFTKASRYRDYQALIPKPTVEMTNGYLVYAQFTGASASLDRIPDQSNLAQMKKGTR
jgi:4-amino-4-deoxy-L-arabinose transferase